MISLLIVHILFVGASIHACRHVSRHILAMEGDKEIFKFLIEPLISQPIHEISKKQQLHKCTSIIGDEEPVFDIPKIIARNRYNKFHFR
jgi:hypothetical protein